MPNGSDLESQRMDALRRLKILDTPPERRFDTLTQIARKHYGVQTALFTVVDEQRQWFKSKQGLLLNETPRVLAFCDHTIRQEKVLVVEDASSDPRFKDNLFVTGDPNIRFYAGMPIREPSGFKIGALCIIDDKPRRIREGDLDILRALARLVEEEVERVYIHSRNSDYVELQHLGRAIQRAQNIFLTSNDQTEAFEVMLSDLLVLTGSQFGFIGDTFHKEDGTPYLKIRAITNFAWSPETHALYQQIERNGMVFDRLDNLIGKALLTRQIVVVNDPGSDPGRDRLPQGQPPITAYVGIPIFAGEKSIGLVWLANRAGGYSSELADELAPLLQTLGHLIERKRLYQERAEHQERLERAANYDELTGLPNRRRLTDLFGRELDATKQRKGLLSVCFIDLDGFKDINDEYGHSVGDEILRIVASNLTSVLRDHDIVARLGGDEFVAILRDVADKGIYSRLLNAICLPLNAYSQVFRVSGSMGVTIYPHDDSDVDMLLRHADQAMYIAKGSGKNQYRFYDMVSDSSLKDRVRVLGEIEQALSKGQLELYYQPKIDLEGPRVSGFEALIRWNHPVEGLLAPGSFLEHLEFTEYAVAVGRFVIDEAVSRLREWEQRGLSYTLSLNLSPSHFLGDTFISDLREELNTCSEFIKSNLVLEILETTGMDHSERVLENLAVCRELGVDISLDDFGTGYSSLDYFRRLPVQEIKIDKSFIMDMLRDPEDEMVVNAIIGLSKNFGRRVVAEGIETKEVQDRLIGLGCTMVQGFYYSRPVPLDQALEWALDFAHSARGELLQ